MNSAIAKVFFGVAFLVSAVVLPWFVTVTLGIIALVYFQLYGTVIVGGLLLDLLFSIPEPHLFGFSYIYTALFLLLALIAVYLERAILE